MKVPCTDALILTGLSCFLGVWTLPDNTSLADIQFIPPPYWSGELTLNLTAVAYELINGDQATSRLSFDIYIEPVASPFDILATDITLPPSGAEDLDLNIVFFDQRGYDLGENPPETIEFTLTNIPDGTFLYASKGGRLEDMTGGTWVFTGTEEQVNALQIANVDAADGTYLVEYSGVTQDAVAILDTPFTDDFGFRVFVNEAPATTGEVVTASADYSASNGNNVIYTSGPANQAINGGTGMDVIFSSPQKKIMTGNGGADQFVWRDSADLQGDLDVITDFNAGQGDQLSLSGLLTNFNIQTDVVSNYVSVANNGDHSIVSIFDGSDWVQVVRLQPEAGVTAQDLWDSGNLLL